MKVQEDPEQKTRVIASNGETTCSGGKNQPEGVHTEGVGKAEMLDHAKSIGHESPRQGAMDDGTPRSAAAQHAEKKQAVLHDDRGSSEPIGVSEEQCGDCREFFRKDAQENDTQHIVADPERTRVFQPDGSVDIYDKDNNFVRTVPPDEPAKATLTKYKGIDW